MKDRLVSHLNMVFKALSIESASEVYDCTFDKLPNWACHLSHSYRYFVCTSAVDKLDILKKFLGKDIYVLGDMLYWYDGDAIETIETIAIITNTAQHTHSIVETQLKSSTRLPSWLDDFIFKTLHAEYAPNHERFDYNLDLSETDIRKYLGTYFPRSYAESFCIFDNLFRNVGYAGEFHSDLPINIAVIGCGTGGDLVGLLTVISNETGGWLDRRILENRTELIERIQGCRNIRIVMYGHILCYTNYTQSGVLYTSAPAVSYAFDNRLAKCEID